MGGVKAGVKPELVSRRLVLFLPQSNLRTCILLVVSMPMRLSLLWCRVVGDGDFCSG